ncbi:synaptotagmin-like protein 2 isoform X2 [Dromaius novaehollandiae]|uniref:synaptotagmin-like protein 2 isoform X2 n=1 Tax=Dromaius novaehollandiae TaxID=8790 RepID=UPI00311FA023
MSKVLDWFKRSSGAGDRKPRSARLQGREPKEDVDFSTRTAVLTTEHSGPSMNGKTQVMEELLFGKTEKLKSVSPPACILEDTQMIKERRKPKQGEKNEKENDKSLTEFDSRRAEEKESGQEIMQQNQKSSLLEHQEYKQPPQSCESEKALREKRSIREIRAFWEREKTIPSHGEKEASVSINGSDGSMLKGLRESDKIKPTAVYLPNGLDDQSNSMLQRSELSNESQALRNEHQNSFEFEPGHAAEKLERTLPSDGEVPECAKLPKVNNLQPRVRVTSSSPESKYKDEKEMFQRKGVSCSQEKPNFKVLSLKEKMNEKSKNHISNPSQFQSLRKFWDTGVKLQSSTEGHVSLRNNTGSITYQRESKEDKKGRGNLSKQELIQEQTQASEREKTEKLGSAVCKLPLESPTLKGLNLTQTKNTNSIQVVRKAFISKPKEKVGVPKQEAKEYLEKNIVSTKEHQNTFNSHLQKLPQVSLQLFQSPDDKDALKQEVAVDGQLCLSIETGEKMTIPSDVDLPKEPVESTTYQRDAESPREVSETIERSVAPSKSSGFSSAWEKLLKEAPETSPPAPRSSDSAEPRSHFQLASQQSYQRDAESPREVSETIERSVAPSKSSGFSSAWEKLLREAPETSPPAPRSSDSAEPRTAEMPVESTTYQRDAESPREVDETIERSVAPSKSSGFSSAWEKLLKEAPETSPPAPRSSDSAEPRSHFQLASQQSYQRDAESPREVSETIERSVAPSKSSGFSSAWEKLLREAPETSPPAPRSSDSAEPRTAEMPVESTTYQRDAESPREVDETIERSVAPSKSSGFSSAWEKLLKEAPETSPPAPKSSDSAEPRTAEMPVESTTYQRDAESPREVSETIERSVAPSKSSGFSSAWEKLLREAPETSPPAPRSSDSAEPTSHFQLASQQSYQRDAESPREVDETIERSVAPSKSSGFSSAWEKLLKEAPETSPPAPKSSDSAEPRTAEMPVESTTYQRDAESPREVSETIERSVAPSKSSGFSSAWEKLLKEAPETSPPAPKSSDSAEPRTAEMPVESTTYQRDAESPREVSETIERSVAPSKSNGFSSAWEKLLKEAPETSPLAPKSSDSAEPRSHFQLASQQCYQRDAESPREVSETIERSVTPSKSSGFSSAWEKLLKEAPETSPPAPRSSDSAEPRTAEMPVESTTYQRDAESPREVSETIERSVAPSKSSGFSSAWEKLLREAPETSPPAPRSSDSAEPTSHFQLASQQSYQRDAESPREVSETTERSVAPSKSSGFSSAWEKLLREAPETSPPAPRSSDSAEPRTAEMPVESTTYQHDAESPREVDETIERSVAPSTSSGFSSAWEKLLKEAPETSPPAPKSSDSAEPRTAEMPVESTTYQRDAESPWEVSETIERSVAPSKSNGFSSAWEKLLKEAPETSPLAPKSSDSAEPRSHFQLASQQCYQRDAESPREVSETIERSVAPSKSSGFSSAWEKLLKEAPETSPPAPRSSDSAEPRTAEMPVESTTYQRDAESPREVSETIERSVAPSKSSGFSSAWEKLLREAPETSPPAPRSSDSAEPRTAEMPVESTTYQRDAESPREVSETIERSLAPSKAEYELFNINLQKLLKEVSEMAAPMLKNMDKIMQDKMQTRQSICVPYQQEKDHPQETEETIKTSFASTHTNFSEVSSSLEKLIKEASENSSPVSKQLHVQGKFQDPMSPSKKDTLSMTMPQPYYNALSNYHTEVKIGIKRETLEQNGKASVVDHVVNEVEASDLPKRNVTLHKREQRNMAPTYVPPLERETKTITIKLFKMNETIKTGESTSLVASENNSELKAPLKFRRASTPLKDESSSPQQEATQLCLTSHHDNEEKGDSSSLGSEFSDENSDLHSGTRSSTRSEEELNPVLMALKRSADRKMPSKSLEDIPSATSNEGKINIPKEELALSAEDVSTVPSQPDKLFLNPEKLKGLSKSVPSFLQEESDDRETDTASESSYSFGRIKKSPSSLTNLSGSSGMASLSSVSGSLMSIYSGDFGNVDVKGNIQFAIDYVEQLNELHIFICQCKDLAVADVKQQRSDPYVKTYLLPEKYKLGKRKTSVKKKTFNPVYNEILRYKIEKAVLKNQRLNISVWHNDTFGRNSFLGEVELDLGTWDWNGKINKQINWFPLKPRASAMALELENRGEMKLALQYVPQPVGGKKTPSTGEVHIWVKECHDLPLRRGNRLNSFIKCTILPDTSRKSRQKTRTVAKTTNPVFNHTMVYDGFRPEDLREACVELTVWDHNKLANHFLGGLRIGLGTGKSYGTTVDWMDSTSAETALWEKMMNSPNTWIEDTLPLRMLMVAKLTK